jgi:hypothetical protein
MIVPTSENTERWIYKRHLWCGVMPGIIVLVPLILPVCDGFERIDFEGDYATRLDIRRIVEKGVIWTFGGPVIGGEIHPTACRFPLLPDDDASDNSAKPATQVPP